MASSSKNINMPLIFAISIGATVSLVAISMFGLAWYEYEARVVLNEQALQGPTHTDAYKKVRDQQLTNLGNIDAAILAVAAENVAEQPKAGDTPAGE